MNEREQIKARWEGSYPYFMLYLNGIYYGHTDKSNTRQTYYYFGIDIKNTDTEWMAHAIYGLKHSAKAFVEKLHPGLEITWPKNPGGY